MCLPLAAYAWATPLSAQLSLSVPPLVKKISADFAPMIRAICLRAFSTASLLALAKE